MTYGFPPAPAAVELICACLVAAAIVATVVALLAYVVADA